MEHFGEKLKKLRKEEGLTQAQLADKLCLNVKTIERLEAGKNIPKLENLQTISDFFNVPISYWYQKECYNYEPDSIYYCIFLERDKMTGITEFVEWIDEEHTKEKRILRSVNPRGIIKILEEDFGQRPMIVNTEKEFTRLLINGGWAIIKQDLFVKKFGNEIM